MLTSEQIRWYRLRRSGLVTPFASPEEVASELMGVQAQILPAAGLALWNRTRGLTHERYEALLYEERRLVKLWGQRSTLHVYAAVDWALICGALRQQQTWWERRIEQRGGDVAAYRRLVGQIEGLLRAQGTLGRSDLRAANLPLKEWHLSSWGGIFTDLVYLGYACHAPQKGGEGRFAHREHWLPDLAWDPPSVEDANLKMTRRYLHTYGPATAQDLAYWRGTRLSEARKWLSALDKELTRVFIGEEEKYALKRDLEALEEAAPPRDAWPIKMLYRFDPLLLPHKDKSWLIEMEQHKRVWQKAGHIEGTLLEYGRIIGTWRYKRSKSSLSITLNPFAPLPAHVQKAVEEEAQGVAEFFGLALAGDSHPRQE